MGKILTILLLAFTGNAFARVMIQPQIKSLIQNFSPNKTVMKSCLLGSPSPNQNIGCVQAYRYMADLCRKRQTVRIDRRYEKDSLSYFTTACTFYDDIADHVSELFELDRKSCAPGFETAADGFVTVGKNADLLDDSALYNYGRSSCQTFQTYVNLCTYIDGNLKTLMPKTYEKLPTVAFSSNPAVSNCKPKNNANDTIYRIDQDLSQLARGGTTANVYEKIISDYRGRKPASQLTVPACDEIRMSYKNLRCNLFEDENNKPKKKKDSKPDEQQQTVSDARTNRVGSF